MQLTGPHSYMSPRPASQKAPVRFGVASVSSGYEVEAREEYRRVSNNPSATHQQREIAGESLQWAEASSRTTKKVLEKAQATIKMIKDCAMLVAATFAKAVEQLGKFIAVTADNIRHVLTHPENKRSLQKGFNEKPW